MVKVVGEEQKGGSILQLELHKPLGWHAMGKKKLSCVLLLPVSLEIDSGSYLTSVNTSASRADVSAEVRASNHGLEKYGAILVAMLV